MTLDRPVVGVSALDALVIEAATARRRDVHCAVDGRATRRGVCFAAMTGATMVEPPMASQALRPLLACVAGAARRSRGSVYRRCRDARMATRSWPPATATGRLECRARWRRRSPSSDWSARADGLAGPPHALHAHLRAAARPRDRARAEGAAVIDVVVERLASPADLDGVLAIEEASFNNPTTREWYEGELKRPEVCFIYVLRTTDQPVAGFCAFWRVAEQIHINNLAIRPELRGHGLGSRLLAGRDRGSRPPRRLARDARGPPIEPAGASALRTGRVFAGRRAAELLLEADRRRARTGFFLRLCLNPEKRGGRVRVIGADGNIAPAPEGRRSRWQRT